MSEKKPQIILDTNILISTALLSKKYGAVLKELSKNRKIDIHISEITRYEYINHVLKKQKENISKIKTAYKNLSAKTKKILKMNFEELNDHNNDILYKSIENEFDTFCKQTNIKITSISQADSFQVMMNYCKRANVFVMPPVKQAKTKRVNRAISTTHMAS